MDVLVGAESFVGELKDVVVALIVMVGGGPFQVHLIPEKEHHRSRGHYREQKLMPAIFLNTKIG